MATASPTIIVPPDAEDFVDSDYLDGTDLVDLATRLRADDDFLFPARHLSITYLWRAKGGQEKGKDRLGATVLVSGLTAYFCATDAILWLAADHCRAISGRAIEAALFHCLCALTVDEKSDAAVLRAPDASVYTAEIAKYGIWRPTLKAVRDAFLQAQLPLDFTNGQHDA